MKKWFRALTSVATAAFGVQSNKNRERDFQNLSFPVLLTAGIVFTTFFVLALLVVVRAVLP